MPDRSNVARRLIAALLALVAGLSASQGRAAQTVPATRAQAPKTVRLYIFDCGVLNVTKEGVERYHVTTGEVGETRMWVTAAASAGGQARRADQTAPEQKPQMAEEVFTNVQLLRGIPVKEFMGTMGFFAAATGMNCTQCHVEESGGSWRRA